jgi:hypothetical protein
LDDGAATFAGTWTNFFNKEGRCDVADKHVTEALKAEAATLQYPEMWGIPLDRINTHSLRFGGANVLARSGYNEMQIQNMGRWHGDIFKTYICKQLAIFSEGMWCAMKKSFGFVNVERGVLQDITSTVTGLAYSVSVSEGAAAA